MEELYAAEDEGCDLALAAPPRNPEGIEKIVAAPLIADRRDGALQQEHRVHGSRVERAGEAGEGMILAVEPQDIAVDDKKAFAEQRQRPTNPAAGFEELLFPRDLDQRMLSRGEPGGDHLRLVMQIDDDMLDPDQGQLVDRVVEQRAAADFDERLWHGVADRAHPGPEAGGENHRRFGYFGHAAPISRG